MIALVFSITVLASAFSVTASGTKIDEAKMAEVQPRYHIAEVLKQYDIVEWLPIPGIRDPYSETQNKVYTELHYTNGFDYTSSEKVISSAQEFINSIRRTRITRTYTTW